MLHSHALRSFRLALAALYLGAAAFNATAGVNRAEEILGDDGFGESTWFGPYEWLLDRVLEPNAVPFMVLLAVFEALVGVFLLMGAFAAEESLVAATVFVLALIPALAMPYLLVNVLLAALQAVVLRNMRAERTGAPAPVGHWGRHLHA